MPITEISRMGVKPDLTIMDTSTPEGQILLRTWSEILAAPRAPHCVYWSLEVEDTSKLWTFFDWDSVEHHEKFARKHGAAIVKDLPNILEYGEFTKHIAFNTTSSHAFELPATQCILAYFAGDLAEEKREEASAQTQRAILKYVGGDHEVKIGWGLENDFPFAEDGKEEQGSVMTAFVGWDDLHAAVEHQNSAAYQELEGVILKMEALRLLRVFHTRWQKLPVRA